jgi:hypothetical protein
MTITRPRENTTTHDRAYARALRRAERRDRRRNRRAGDERHEAKKRTPETFLAKPLPVTSKGFVGENGGRWGLMPRLATWISSSVQVCGLYPWTIGSARPPIGVPLGPDLTNWSLVYCDPVAWFKAGLISNPSVMVFGLPGLGKSTLIIRWILGLADRGYAPMILGDLKGEYSSTVRALGGEVIEVAPGKCTINPLDLGALVDAAGRITDVAWVPDANDPHGGKTGAEIAAALRGLALQQAATLVIALARLVRGAALQDFEETLIAVAVRVVHDQVHEPQLKDLVALLEQSTPHEELLRATVSTSADEYRKTARRLLQTLRSILHGPMGVMFDGPTTVQLRVDNPGGVSVDLSGMRRTDNKVLAAVMISIWAHGFSAIDAQWELFKAGLGEFRNPFVVGDELWKPMGLAPGMAKLIGQLFRTNRTEGVAQAMVTHSPKDALQLPTHEDRETALGFAENAGMLVMFGMAKNGLQALDETTISLNDEERRQVASWRSPRSFRGRRSRNGRPKPPPGAGKALIKVQDATGIAVQIVVVDEELALHDTNERWNQQPAGERAA